MSGSTQYINPVTAARGSRAVRCNITWAVERLPLFNVLSSSSRLQTVLLIERAKWISAYCLPVCLFCDNNGALAKRLRKKKHKLFHDKNIL